MEKRKPEYWKQYRKVRSRVHEHLSVINEKCDLMDQNPLFSSHVPEENQSLPSTDFEPLPSFIIQENDESSFSDHHTGVDLINGSSQNHFLETPQTLPTSYGSDSNQIDEQEQFSDPPSYISDSDSELDDDIREQGLEDEIQNWATTFKITHSSLRALLSILRVYHPSLPKDPRTLLKTNRVTESIEVDGGVYYHFGFVSSCLQAVERASSVCLAEIQSISVQFNIDGLPLFKSTNAQLWPILCRIIEPFETAPFIVGLFSGNKKPGNVVTYLQHLREELDNVLQNGINIPNSDKKVSVKISCFVCDTPARAFVKQTKGHSGYYGCDKCCQKGKWVDKMTFPEVDSPLRTDLQFDELSNEEHHIGQSPFIGLPIGMVSQFPLDYMHLVCLGVTRRLLWLWIKGPLFCRQGAGFVKQVSLAIMESSKYMPREVLRKGRHLSELDRWKATEFRQFLLYSGPVILSQLLPVKYYRHFMLLSVAVYCLSSPVFCSYYCEYAKQLLVLFVKQMEELYGNKQYVYNIHALVHLADDVSLYGSLDRFSAFPFESFLGRLKRLVRKPNYVLAQVVNRLSENCIDFSITGLKSSFSESFVKMQHHNGPLPMEYSQYLQFKQLISPEFYLSIKQGDNCIFARGKAWLITNILSLAEDCRERLLIVESFTNATEFYTQPLQSTDLHIYKVGQPSDNIEVVNLNEITAKCVILPCKSKYVVIPLLHTFKLE